jgi:hypothetical protein
MLALPLLATPGHAADPIKIGMIAEVQAVAGYREQGCFLARQRRQISIAAPDKLDHSAM